jgi:hypothetical protein
MKSKKTKKELIDVVLENIVLDIHVGDHTALAEMLNFIPVENLVAYLPDEDFKKFYHLITEEYLKKEEDDLL